MPTGAGRILSNIVRTQWEKHRPFGGVVPEIAARAHVECLDTLVRAALDEAAIGFDDLDAVAATAGPGLIGGLIAGLITGKAIALARRLPFLAVHHLEAHALTVGLTEGLRPPYVLLLVSGGHTQLLIVRGVGDYQRLGTTIDDALGEAFDKTAKLLGLGFPGGPAVELAARSGDAKRFELPRPMLGREELHFSFAGLKTAVRRLAERLAPLTEQDVADIAAAFELAVTECVVGPLRPCARARGARRFPCPAASLSPVASPRTCACARRCKTWPRTHGYSFHAPPSALCSDNAAMIAWVGAERLALGQSDPLDAPVRPRWPLDASAKPAIGAGVKA